MPFERKYTCNDLAKMVGAELGVSEWIKVEQEMMNGFGAATRDNDWLHLNPERAAAETGYGGTIAFGFWTLSMLTFFSHDVGMWPSDIGYGLNYGLDRVRWINPVPVGSRIRNRCTLLSFEQRDEGKFLIRTSNTVEIENRERPALLAEWLGLFVRSAA
jgi:acyl dehydratase